MRQAKRVAIYARVSTDDLLKAAARRQIDLVAAWPVDRLGRSLRHLVSFLDEIHITRVDLYLHQQGIDTRTPAGKALFQMCGVFAEFERSMIQERVKAGIARAKASGKALGRPRVSQHIEERIRELRASGRHHQHRSRATRGWWNRAASAQVATSGERPRSTARMASPRPTRHRVAALLPLQNTATGAALTCARSTKSEKRQHSENDHDCANDVDDVIHAFSLREVSGQRSRQMYRAGQIA
jgi:DNA invertase Pin-like site-specific DNA recombinase